MGKWGNGKWEMGNGKWEMGNGKWEMGKFSSFTVYGQEGIAVGGYVNDSENSIYM
jgi:hypothetical protein